MERLVCGHGSSGWHSARRTPTASEAFDLASERAIGPALYRSSAAQPRWPLPLQPIDPDDGARRMGVRRAH